MVLSKSITARIYGWLYLFGAIIYVHHKCFSNKAFLILPKRILHSVFFFLKASLYQVGSYLLLLLLWNKPPLLYPASPLAYYPGKLQLFSCYIPITSRVISYDIFLLSVVFPSLYVSWSFWRKWCYRCSVKFFWCHEVTVRGVICKS